MYMCSSGMSKESRSGLSGVSMNSGLKKCECSFTGKLVYERIFRKSSTFTPGSNIPTMLPGKDFETNKTISI